jgi:hypothetical protein
MKLFASDGRAPIEQCPVFCHWCDAGDGSWQRDPKHNESLVLLTCTTFVLCQR